MWVWETERLLLDPAAADALIALCKGHHIDRVFLQLPRSHEGKLDLRSFGRLIGRLSDRGILSEALDGAPNYLERSNHNVVLSRVDAVVEHNRRAPPPEQFTGFRLDVEPHALPRFAADRTGVIRDYIFLVDQVRTRLAGSGLAFGIDMPFWFDGELVAWGPPSAHHYRLSDAVIERADNIAVLAYRTEVFDQNGILDLTRFLLFRARALGKWLYIGVETSPAGGDGSFYRRSEAEFLETIRQTDEILYGRKSFAGFAVHSYESLRDLHRTERNK